MDDESGIRSLLSDWVRALGCSAEEASSADQALEIMKDRRVDVVLCDICMPGHDGIWLINQLRRSFPDAAIIIATGLTQMDPSVIRSPNVAAYITKPFSYEEFDAAVTRAFAAVANAARCS